MLWLLNQQYRCTSNWLAVLCRLFRKIVLHNTSLYQNKGQNPSRTSLNDLDNKVRSRLSTRVGPFVARNDQPTGVGVGANLTTTQNDYRCFGKFQGWQDMWPPGRAVKCGLSWPWIQQPSTTIPITAMCKSVRITTTVANMLHHRVIEETSAPVFLSHLFMVLKHNSEELCFVLELSILNSFIQTLKYWILTVPQIRLHIHRWDWLAAID